MRLSDFGNIPSLFREGDHAALDCFAWIPEEGKYRCLICDGRFETSGWKRQHVRRKHPEVPT